jgi:hypothetical protein
MVTLAQTLIWKYGESAMANSINRGEDQHCRLVAEMINEPYATVMERKKAKDPIIGPLRFAGKAGNFGTAGGMGAAKFCVSKRQDKSPEFPRGVRFCDLLGRQQRGRCGTADGIPYVTSWNRRECPPVCPVCCECAVEIKQAYLKSWPEMVQFFKDAGAACQQEGGAYLEIPGTNGVVRGPLNYTQYCNSHFQPLAAVGSKRALAAVNRACYYDRASPCYGVCRPVAFIHDEIIAEIWLPSLDAAGREMARLMVDAMQQTCPDVLVKAEPAAAFRLYKAMEYKTDAAGRLVPWSPNTP